MEAEGSNKTGRRGHRGLYLIIASLVFLGLGIFSGNRYRDQPYTGKDVSRFEKTLHAKERLLKK